MAKQKSAGEARPAKWIKFVGVRSDSWRAVLDQLTIDRIPYDYVTEIRFHFQSGKTYAHPVTTLSERELEMMLERLDSKTDSLTAMEFIVDLDSVYDMVTEQVKIVIEGAKDGE